MADISEKLHTIIRQYIHQGKYFTISQARQYGKTTILYLLEQYLKEEYLVSRICQLADERLPAASAFKSLHEVWTPSGISAAEQLDLFLSELAIENTMYQTGLMERNQYIVNGT